MSGGRPTKYDPAFCQTVIECGKQGMTLAEMADALNVNRATVNEWTQQHEEFSSAVKLGLEKALSWWERNGRTATFGSHPGFNATSYIFQMKNRFRDDWRDKVEQEHSGGVTVEILRLGGGE